MTSSLQEDSKTQIPSLKARIDTANTEVLRRIYAADPVLVDIIPARQVIPALNTGEKLVLHSGPPVTWKDMCGAQRGAVIGIVIFEGWATNPDEARALCENGTIRFEPNHHHNACGPMAGTISPSFPIYVVENKTFGNSAFSRMADLSQQFGNYNNLEACYFWRDVAAPALSKALRSLGGLKMNPTIARALEMGDECHNRNNALTSLFVQELTIGMIDADVPSTTLQSVLRWFAPDTWTSGAGVRACIGLAMATAKAILDPTIDVEYSTVVTCMARNGFEFGIRLSATGRQWFTAPAPMPDCKYFPPYTRHDSGLDMGDSAITETVGWGCFVLDGGLAFLRSLPTTPKQAIAITEENAEITLGRSPTFLVPFRSFAGTPTGIDIRKVITKKINPWINTGVAHKDSGHGVIGRGLVRAPMACFEKALQAFAQKYQTNEETILATL